MSGLQGKELICRIYNISDIWLREGQGNMHPFNADEEPLVSDIILIHITPARRVLNAMFRVLNNDDWERLAELITAVADVIENQTVE